MEMALSLRNNRTYGMELVMPMNAIALDNDEMEYVDGGYEFTVQWWGLRLKLNGDETKNFLEDYTFGGAVLSAVAGVASGPAGAVLAIILATQGYAISLMNRNNSGVTFHWTWPVVPRLATPEIYDNY